VKQLGIENRSSSPEDINMCSGAFQAERLIIQAIYQQPVRFDMTIPATFEIASQRVVPMF
jgi:hypothetical protein